MAANDIKRLNYFTGQFLEAQDFIDEQSYHLEMRRRRNRLQMGPGVLDGLGVTKTGAKEVTSPTEPPWTIKDANWSCWPRTG